MAVIKYKFRKGQKVKVIGTVKQLRQLGIAPKVARQIKKEPFLIVMQKCYDYQYNPNTQKRIKIYYTLTNGWSITQPYLKALIKPKNK